MDINNIESLEIKDEYKKDINKYIINKQIISKDIEQNQKIDKMNNFHSNENIKKNIKVYINQNKNDIKKIYNKSEINLSKGNMNNKSNSYKMKPRRIIDNYSYYFKLKEKEKISANKIQ